MSQSSAVAWVVSERQALIRREDDGAPAEDSFDRSARIEELTRLLFDVRAGRTEDFLLPTSRGKVRVFVTPD